MGFAETESLRSLLGGREAEAVALREQARKEREELVSRLLTDKGRYISRVWCHTVLLYYPYHEVHVENLAAVRCFCRKYEY